MDASPTEPIGKRVLIADDDDVYASVARAILTEGGYVCDVVNTGSEVRDAVAGGSYDCVVADIHMPGNEFLELLDVGREANVPVVIVTGEPSIDTAITSLRGGAVDYVKKPSLPAELLRAVDRAVAKKKMQQQVADSAAALKSLVERAMGVEAQQPSPQSAGEPSEEALAGLSARERQVARMFAAAAPPKQIAAALGVSEATVRNHLKAIYRKFGVHSQLELFVRLQRGG